MIVPEELYPGREFSILSGDSSTTLQLYEYFSFFRHLVS